MAVPARGNINREGSSHYCDPENDHSSFCSAFALFILISGFSFPFLWQMRALCPAIITSSYPSNPSLAFTTAEGRNNLFPCSAPTSMGKKVSFCVRKN